MRENAVNALIRGHSQIINAIAKKDILKLINLNASLAIFHGNLIKYLIYLSKTCSSPSLANACSSCNST